MSETQTQEKRSPGATVEDFVGQDEPLATMAEKLSQCHFGCWNGAKRFVARLAAALSAGQDLDATLTDKQKVYLRGLRHSYREQIDALPNVLLRVR